MSNDSFTEVTRQSWGSRMGGSAKGTLFGFVLLAVGVSLLWWNEGRAVARAKALEEGAGQVVSIAAEPVDAAYEGKLVHLSGRATSNEVLRDPDFGIQAQAIRLIRSVEMYQWREHRHSETRETLGGGTETVTTYSYDKGWESQAIQSSSFKRPEGHENPGHMAFDGQVSSASVVTLGAFRLSPSLIGEINRATPISLNGEEAGGLRLPTRDSQVSGNEVYIGRDPGQPRIGDLRVQFSAVYPADISLVSMQRGDSFVPYRASNGNEVELLEYGTQSAEQMFQAAQDRNSFLTWMLRLAGFVALFISIRLLLGTLRILAAVVPFLGRLVGGAIGIVAFILASFIALITIAIAWLFYRPLLAVGLLAAAVAVLFGLKKAGSGAETPAAVAPAAPPPPPPV